MPRHVLALALIKLTDVPLAAPSANASTKPSPTAAEHVAYDLDGRIETIIDGGPCDVGVESTVVHGLSQPPLILRPGGISLEQLQSCAGWENTQLGYKNVAEIGSQPKAPGMKYRHYSPKAPVILFDAGRRLPSTHDLRHYVGSSGKLGLVRTRLWELGSSSDVNSTSLGLRKTARTDVNGVERTQSDVSGFAGVLKTLELMPEPQKAIQAHVIEQGGPNITLLDISLGPDVVNIARGIFAALRELDKEGVDGILVEGIDDAEGDTAAAVMNRLRKAAEIRVAR